MLYHMLYYKKLDKGKKSKETSIRAQGERCCQELSHWESELSELSKIIKKVGKEDKENSWEKDVLSRENWGRVCLTWLRNDKKTLLLEQSEWWQEQ